MLEIDSVTLSYGGREILSGCYLQCNKGEILGLLGRNGSGKSSLLKIIFGSLKADFKHLKVDGKLINKAYQSKQVSYLAQTSFLPNSYLVYEVINTFQKKHPPILDKAMLNKLAGLKIKDLSSGELKLIEFLWILNLDSSYILLDEPFSGISPLYISVMQKLILEASKSKGILITDHIYRPLMEISHRILLLHNNAVYPIKHEDDLIRYHYLPEQY